MSNRNWFAAVAFGLALSFGALAQETTQPALEGEQIPSLREEEGAPAGEQDTAAEHQNASDLLPAIKGIESAIRDLIAEEDQIEREAERRRNDADLRAQQEMARWAFWATFAAGASVFLTAVGVVLISLTLHHTRRAADYAKDMVVEAEKTTAAAIEGANASLVAAQAGQEANRIAAEQYKTGFRPWLEIAAVGPFADSHDLDPLNFQNVTVPQPVPLMCGIRVRNIGEMPATLEGFEMWVMGGDKWPFVRESPPWFRTPHEPVFHVLNRGEAVMMDQHAGVRRLGSPGEFPAGVVELTNESRIEFLTRPPPVVGKFVYSDPLGIRRELHFAFRSPAHWGSEFVRYGGRTYNHERELDEAPA